MTDAKPDDRLDLVLQRVVDVPPHLVWRAWTEPEHLKPWFCPAPWRAVEAEIDLRPAGIFRTVMRGPAGEEFGGAGCYLEVVPNRRLVWTSALGPGYRPSQGYPGVPHFTAIITIEPHGNGAKYTALAMHGDEDSRNKHAEMGFTEGWGKALDQLVVYAKTM